MKQNKERDLSTQNKQDRLYAPVHKCAQGLATKVRQQ